MSDLELKIAALELRISKLEAMLGKGAESQTPLRSSTKPLSIKEFLNTKQLVTANDRVLAMGYFLENHEGQEDFSAEDIKACFRAAKIPAPKNVNDVINKNIAKAFVMESGKPRLGIKYWVLTASGEEFVEKGLNKEE